MTEPDRAAATPLDEVEFEAALAAFSPFEAQPHLAVAVSGGADSLALALLAARWAAARGGRVTALTVDHDLRPESAREAASVGDRLRARGIPHRVLHWAGPHEGRNIQAEARAARYRLLRRYCAEAGILHLLTAHHRDDQAETLLIRLGRGSGLAGLAGMAPVVETPELRLLRPLLAVPKTRLRAFLQAEGQGWVEDPSNLDPRFARGGLRRSGAALAEMGLTGARLAETAARLGAARRVVEAQVDVLLADSVRLDPLGIAWLRADGFASRDRDVRLAALAAVLATVAGAEYPPRAERLNRLDAALFRAAGEGRRRWTLGGCRLAPFRGEIAVSREIAALALPVTVSPGQQVVWDGRFRAALEAGGAVGFSLGALGSDGISTLRGIVPGVDSSHLPCYSLDAALRLPRAALAVAAALRWQGMLAAVPALGWKRADIDPSLAWPVVAFRPRRLLSGGGFEVLQGASGSRRRFSPIGRQADTVDM